MTDLPDIGAVDQEYETRWSWWRFLPDAERETFAQAERDGNGKVLVQLTKRGKRRETHRAYDTCCRRAVIQGIVFADDPEDDPACECMTKALDSDKLATFLEGRKLAGLEFAHAVRQLHDDPDLTVDKWVAAERRKQKAKAPDPETTALDHTPPTKDLPPANLAPSVEPASPEPPPPSAPISRTPRWYDELGIHDLEHYIF
jgi:hypothetical protein